MIDLNNILTQALTAAVAEATKPLLERIEKLETNCNAYEILFKSHIERIEALEGVDHERQHALTARYLGGMREDIDALKSRVWALEQGGPAQGDTLSPDDLVQVKQRIEALEQATPVGREISAAAFVTYLDQQEWFWEKLMRKAGEAAEAAAEEALNDHCQEYDHDDYDRVSCSVNDANLDDMVTMNNLRDEIKQVLRDATVSIDI